MGVFPRVLKALNLDFPLSIKVFQSLILILKCNINIKILLQVSPF